MKVSNLQRHNWYYMTKKTINLVPKLYFPINVINIMISRFHSILAQFVSHIPLCGR